MHVCMCVCICIYVCKKEKFQYQKNKTRFLKIYQIKKSLISIFNFLNSKVKK